MIFALGVPLDRVLALASRRCAAQSNDDRDDVDIDLEEIELARHLTQFLSLAGDLLRDVGGHVTLGDPARAADEQFGPDPRQSCALRVALELLFNEFPPGFRIGSQKFNVGQLAQGFD